MILAKGFDISTTEGASAFLESQGIDVDQYFAEELAYLKRQKAMEIAESIKCLPENFCKHCGGPCLRKNVSYPEDEEI